MNAPLPIVHSILDADALGAEIQAHFGLPGAVRCELFTRGMNDVYLVRAAGRRYAARAWRCGFRSESDVVYELEYLTYLDGAGVPLPASVAAPTGSRYFTVAGPEGARHVALFDWIDGRAYGTAAEPRLAARIGRLLAEVHRLAPGFRPSAPRFIDYTAGIRDGFAALAELVAHRPDDLAYYAEARDALTAALFECEAKDLPGGPTHGDFHAFNAFVDGEDRITLMDFDNCGEGHFAQELMSFVWSARKSELGEAVVDGFLEGYDSVRPLAGSERELFPLLLAVKEFRYLCGFAANVNAVGHVAFRWPGLDWFAQSVRCHVAAAKVL